MKMSTLLVSALFASAASTAFAQDASDPQPVTPQTYDPHYDRAAEENADAATHEREEERRNKRDVFFLVPEVGVEVANFATGIANTGTQVAGITSHSSAVYAAPAFGVDAGFRLGYINLGVRYQRSWFSDTSVNSLNLNKLYGVAGVTFGKRTVVGQVFGAFGYAFIDQQGTGIENGLGGEIGASIDFYVLKWLSLGLQASVDAQGYKTNNSSNLLGVIGGTGLFRLGFHI